MSDATPPPFVAPPSTGATPARVIPRFRYKPEWSRRWSGAAIVGFVLAAATTALVLTLKTVGAVLNVTADQDEELSLLAGQLGGLLLFSIAPAVTAVVLGHVGMSDTWGGRMRGWVLSGLALGAGYLHLLLWCNRVINATIVAVAYEDLASFMPSFFWWA